VHEQRRSVALLTRHLTETSEIQDLYHRVQKIGQWLIFFSKPASTAGDGVGLDSQEMQELRSQFNDMGLRPAYNLNDWRATLEDESNAIKMQLDRMRNDPACRHMFT